MRQKLTLANQISELERLSQWVEQVGRELDLSDRQVFHLNLALEELVTNVMKYAYGPGGNGAICLEMEADPERLTVRVIDSGPEFNPLALPQPSTDLPLEERRVGGVGIYLTEKVIDQLSYRRRRELNELTLVMARGRRTDEP